MEFGNGPVNDLIWRSNDNRYHNADIEKIELDNENVNIAILANQVCDGAAVLDIGCGEGKFGCILRKKHCSLYGIDMDGEAGSYAKGHYDYKDVFLFNVEDKSDSPEKKRFETLDIKFDHIAMLDVLEHLINPTAAVLNMIPFLKDGGSILVSLPNLNNADIFLNLLRDRFNYQQSGVLDNTHVKYFTRWSFIDWISEINKITDFALDCRYIGSIYGYTGFMEEIKSIYPYVYGFIQKNPWFHVIQHLFVLDYHSDKSVGTPELDRLMSEEPVNLIPVLEKYLEGTEGSESSSAALLENERSIMEQQILAANKGWKESAEAIEEARKFIDKLEADNKELTDYARKLEGDIAELQSARKFIDKLEADNKELTDYARKLEGDIAELQAALDLR